MNKETTLSQSSIWKLQADFYEQQGPQAWSKGIVPQYITTNPYFANLYAKSVFAYCRDLIARPNYNPNTCLYILELAAGVGRFTYAFLKSFSSLIEKSTMKDLKFKYIVSDFAEQNVRYWQNHPSLKPYFENGVLDCAVFDVTKDDSLTLLQSGEKIEANVLQQPLVVIANYTFDSLPQDTFYVKEGLLYEGLIRLSKANKKDSEQNDEALSFSQEKTSILSDIQYEYIDREIDGSCYYDNTLYNDLLLHYQENLEDASFTLPIMAFRCIERLRTLFGDDLILIAADKGYNQLESMLNTYHPFLSQHGSISLMVNFHAIELFFEHLGGRGIHSLYEHDNITLSLFSLSKVQNALIETNFAFEDIVEGIGPEDFHTLKNALIPHQKTMSSKELLTFLRYTSWDSRTFLEIYNTLIERISEEENFPINDLITSLYKVWENYFPIGEEGDLSYCLATLFAHFGYDDEAIELFKTSIAFYGETAPMNYEIALSYYNLQEVDEAMTYLEKSLALDPDFEEALYLKNVIASL